ncbi:PilC/PilY family type IV pilus protein [Neisseriaceae bacterium B1]
MSKMKHKNFALKPMVTFLTIGLSLSAHAAKKEFADVPLHLTSKSTVSTAIKLKPNVILQIDDSGSMSWDINGQPRYREIRDRWGRIFTDPNSPNPYFTGQTRMDMTRPAFINVINKYADMVNMRMITLNNNVVDLRSSNQKFLDGQTEFGEKKSDLLNYANQIQPNSGTPSTSRYLDSLLILDKALKYRCQQSYVIIFSDGEPSEIKSNYFKNNGGISYSILPKNNNINQQIWFADSRKYNFKMDLDQNPGSSRWGSSEYYVDFDSANVAKIIASSFYNTDLRKSGEDAAQKSWDDPIFLNGKQNIVTYSVGLGLNSTYLDNLSTGNNGKAFSAKNQQQLNDALDKIFQSIASNIPANNLAESFSNIAPTLNTQDTNKSAVNSAATIRLDLQSGSSEIRFYALKGAKFDTSFQTPSYTNRKTLINIGGSGNKAYLSDNLPKEVDNAFFDITGTNTNEWKEALLPWITRTKNDADIAKQSSNSLQYRVREEGKRNMGDVLTAPIQAFGDSLYGRQKYLVTAANDGLVYIFQSENNANNPYDLKLNYMPAGMQRSSDTDTLAKNLKNIVDPNYIKDASKKHQYMINGGFVMRKMDEDGARQIFMAGNMGQGGRGSYALNIGGKSRAQPNADVGIDAKPDQWDKTVPLFETPKTDNKFGYTIGSPQIGRISLNRSVTLNTNNTVDLKTDLSNVVYATFVNSGVNHPDGNQETALYVYNSIANLNVGKASGSTGNTSGGNLTAGNLTAGQLLKKITVGNTGGLAQPTLVDTNFDGVIDVAYAGDFNGGLYRFDLRGNTDQWSATKIFQAKEKQVITSAPAVYRNKANEYVVIFGTGSDLFVEDLNNKDIQSVYGIYDNLAVSAVEHKIDDLVQQNLTAGTAKNNIEVRNLSDNELGDKKGWYFDLSLTPGERVVVKPTVALKTVMITTRHYTTSTSSTAKDDKDVCVREESQTKSESESWVMQVKADNGGQIPKSGEKASTYAYLDVFGENKNRSSDFRPEVMIAAFKNAGGIFNGTFILGVAGTNENKFGHLGNSCSINGDCGGNGTDAPLNETPPEIKECFQSTTGNALYGSTTKDGLSSPIGIYGKKCSSSLRRLSWREIF